MDLLASSSKFRLVRPEHLKTFATLSSIESTGDKKL
jgi:hypothetical protein